MKSGCGYAQARSYQVRTGRFNAPDPVYAGRFEPQQWNRYTYAVSNPLSFTDPSGLNPLCPSGECKPSDETLIMWMFGRGMPGNDTQDPPGRQIVLLGGGRQQKPEEPRRPTPPEENPERSPMQEVAVNIGEVSAKIFRCAAAGANRISLASLGGASPDNLTAQTFFGNDVSTLATLTFDPSMKDFVSTIISNPFPANLTARVIDAGLNARVGPRNIAVGRETSSGHYEVQKFVREPARATKVGSFVAHGLRIASVAKVWWDGITFAGATVACTISEGSR